MPRKKQSIRKIVNRLTKMEDLFKETIPEVQIVEAVHRWLRSLGDDRTKYVVLKSCADSLASCGYPHLSAAIMETAGQHFANPRDPKDRTWLEGMSLASSYWLQAGNFEARQASLLKSAGLALRVTSQKDLFPDDEFVTSLDPLWKLANELRLDEQYSEAASVYDNLFNELNQIDDYERAFRASLLCSHCHAYAMNWNVTVDKAKVSIQMASMLPDATEMLAEAHLVVGIGYIQYKPEPLVNEALKYLATAKDLYDEVPNVTPENMDRVHIWLGSAYAMQGELFLSDYYTNKMRSYLEQADRSYSLAIGYYEHMMKLPVRELGASCALLSVVCRELGDEERANELATKAMSYGISADE